MAEGDAGSQGAGAADAGAAADAAGGAQGAEAAGGAAAAGGAQGADAVGPDAFLNQLPDGELRDFARTKGWDGPAALLKSYRALESKVGEKGVVLPKDPEDAEAWGAVYDALGRPPSPDKYELPALENAPAFYADEVLQAMLPEVHAAGLTAKQVAAMRAAFVKHQGAYFSQAGETFKAQMTAEDNALKAELGEKYRPILSYVETLFGGPESDVRDEFQALGELVVGVDTKLKEHPYFKRLFAKLADGHYGGPGEGGLPGLGQGGLGGARNAREAQAEKDRLLADESFRRKATNISDPGHAEARERLNRLDTLIAAAKGGKAAP